MTDNTPFPNYSVFLRSSDYTKTIDNYKSNLIFELNQTIRCFSNMHMNVKLSSFKFNNCFYSINDNNCIFSYQFSGFTVVNMTLTKSNYNIDTFLTYLTSIFGSIFLFTYDNASLKITITSISGISFRLLTPMNNCLEVLGFDTDIITSYSIIQAAPYLMNLIGVEVLHIVVSNLSLNSIGVKNKKRYNILDSVHITAPKGENQCYTNMSDFKFKISDDIITYLNIIIYDQNFNVINFNNIDYYINIVFSFSYINELKIPNNLLDNKFDNENDMKSLIIKEEYNNLVNYYQNKNI